jgi:hypothetical protein
MAEIGTVIFIERREEPRLDTSDTPSGKFRFRPAKLASGIPIDRFGNIPLAAIVIPGPGVPISEATRIATVIGPNPVYVLLQGGSERCCANIRVPGVRKVAMLDAAGLSFIHDDLIALRADRCVQEQEIGRGGQTRTHVNRASRFSRLRSLAQTLRRGRIVADSRSA